MIGSLGRSSKSTRAERCDIKILRPKTKSRVAADQNHHPVVRQVRTNPQVMGLIRTAGRHLDSIRDRGASWNSAQSSPDGQQHRRRLCVHMTFSPAFGPMLPAVVRERRKAETRRNLPRRHRRSFKSFFSGPAARGMMIASFRSTGIPRCLAFVILRNSRSSFRQRARWIFGSSVSSGALASS